MEPIPPIPKIFSLVAQQVRQMASNFLVTNVNNASTNRNISTSCSFYGKIGHIENVCFKKVGFPNQDYKTFRTNSHRKVCTHCGKTSHTIDTCYRKHGFPPGFNFTHTKTNQVHNVVLSDEVFSKHCNQEQEQGGIRLTVQQYQVLSTLFKQHTSSNATTPQQAQVNQVGSFTVDSAHNGTTQSPPGNIFFFNIIKPARCLWILDSRRLTMYAHLYLISHHIKAFHLFSLVYQMSTVFSLSFLGMSFLIIESFSLMYCMFQSSLSILSLLLNYLQI